LVVPAVDSLIETVFHILPLALLMFALPPPTLWKAMVFKGKSDEIKSG
jgi:hypothetical protein